MNRYVARLYTPTQIIKIKSTYFIIDCWHHRVIYSQSILSPIVEWQALDSELAGPHSMASDGEIYVTESTGTNEIVAYHQTDFYKFKEIQRIQNVGIRPHRTIYDPIRKVFFVIGSGNQALYIFRNLHGELVHMGSFSPRELSGQYVRSVTVHNDVLYFVGNFNIVQYALGGYEFKFIKNVELPRGWTRANDIFFTGERSGFLTAKHQRMYYFANIDEIEHGKGVDLTRHCIGTPYYVSVFDNAFWVPEIDEYSRICRYKITDGKIDFNDRDVIFDCGEATVHSEQRKASLKL